MSQGFGSPISIRTMHRGASRGITHDGPGGRNVRVSLSAPRGALLLVPGYLQGRRDEAGEPLEIIGSWADITTRKRAEEELQQAVEELKALGEVGQAVSSSLDLPTVLTTIVAHAVQLSRGDAGTIYEFDEATQVFVPRANRGISAELVEAIRRSPQRVGDHSAIGQAAARRAPVEILDPERAELSAVIHASGGLPRAARRAVPARRAHHRRVGCPAEDRRRVPAGDREPPPDLRDESVLAIQNARLFQGIRRKGRVAREPFANMDQLDRLSPRCRSRCPSPSNSLRVLEAARQPVGVSIVCRRVGRRSATRSARLPTPGCHPRSSAALAGGLRSRSRRPARLARCIRASGSRSAFTSERPIPPALRPSCSTLLGDRSAPPSESLPALPMIAGWHRRSAGGGQQGDRAADLAHRSTWSRPSQPGRRGRRERRAVPGDPAEEPRTRDRQPPRASSWPT